MKQSIEELLHRVTAPLTSIIGRSRATILAYHGIVPDDWVPLGDGSLHMRIGRFCEHLDALQTYADVVALDDLLMGTVDPTSRHPVALTFDDAYHGAVELGLAELRRRDLPATLFCAPALLDGADFWWDRWLGADNFGDLTEFRNSALIEHQGISNRIEAVAVASGRRAGSTDVWIRGCSSDLLRAAAREGKVTVGSHTWDHPNLGTLVPDAAIELTLRRAWDWLQESGLPVTTALALPYGGFQERVQPIARRIGHRHILRSTGGRMRRAVVAEEMIVPRFTIPAQLSAAGLLLSLGGIRGPSGYLGRDD